MKRIIHLLLFLVMTQNAYAAIHTELVEYRDGEAVLEGYLAFDEDRVFEKRPGMLIIHDWMGLGDFAKKKADEMAALGYTAFAADIYGKGVRPADQKEAGEQASIYKKDRQLMRSRSAAALEVLKKNLDTDPARIAAMGYCFGGMAVLELARSGADVKGVISFHGGLDTPNPEDAKNIKAKVLVLHGADDPFAPAKDVQALEEEMRNAKVDWQVVLYGGAVHSFTNPAAGGDPSKGAAYNASADKRSWQAMLDFVKEILSAP